MPCVLTFPDELPVAWREALQAIADCPDGVVLALSDLPGGPSMAASLEAAGWAERWPRAKAVTLTPWAMSRLALVIDEHWEPVTVKADGKSRRDWFEAPRFVNPGDASRWLGVRREACTTGLPWFDDLEAPGREWYADSDGSGDGEPIPAPEPLRDERTNPLTVGGVPIFAQAEVKRFRKREAARRRRATKVRKASRRVARTTS